MKELFRRAIHNITGRPHDRFARALALIPFDSDKKARAFFKLYCEATDATSADWLNLLASVYGNASTQFYDVRRYHQTLMRGVKLGSSVAAYNLGVGYREGQFDGRVDVAQAKRWFETAAEFGNPEGHTELFFLLRDTDDFSNDGRVEQEAFGHLELAANGGSPTGLLNYARYAAEIDFEQSLAQYRRLSVEEGIDEYTPIYSRWALGLHHFLGVEVDEDADRALEYFDRIANARTVNTLTMSYVQKAKFLAEHIRQTNIFDFTSYEVKQVWGGAKTLQQAMQFYNDKIRPTERKFILVWAANELCEFEQRRSKLPVFNEWLRLLEPKCLGVSPADLERSKTNFGVIHNRFTTAGAPVPAAYANIDIEANEMGAFLGVRASPDGAIRFRFAERDRTISPLLVGEDIKVALSLAFSGEHPIWPRFSLEPLWPNDGMPPYASEAKLWQPEWLSETQFGKTMYATDVWMDAIAQGDKAAFATPHFPLNPEAKELLDELRAIGGYRLGVGARLFIHPLTVQWNWHQDDDGTMVCDLGTVQMGVSGADQVIENNALKDHAFGVNDLNSVIGRKTRYLTENYDRIARLWPTFERARQLNALIYVTNQLRLKGYQPNFSTSLNANFSALEFASRRPSGAAHQLVL